MIKKEENFAFETTLSGLSYLQMMKDAKAAGYEITFFFVFLNSLELAKKRVTTRVSKGGYNISFDVIERRYTKGLDNLSAYVNLSSDWYIYDNSNKEYELVAKSIAGQKEIINFETYNKLNSNGAF